MSRHSLCFSQLASHPRRYPGPHAGCAGPERMRQGAAKGVTTNGLRRRKHEMSGAIDSGPSDAAGRFSLVVGGPFHALPDRLRLTGADQLPTQRAASAPALLA